MSASKVTPPKSPSEELTSKILASLSEEKLIETDDAQKYSQRIASGKMTSEDWRRVLERKIDLKAKGNE